MPLAVNGTFAGSIGFEAISGAGRVTIGPRARYNCIDSIQRTARFPRDDAAMTRRPPLKTHPRPAPARRRRSRSLPVLPVVLLLCGGTGTLLGGRDPGHLAQPLQAAQHCRIKGNVSIATGERIYHVPGQADYERTKIRPSYGERWFCSEAEARGAGWRRATN